MSIVFIISLKNKKTKIKECHIAMDTPYKSDLLFNDTNNMHFFIICQLLFMKFQPPKSISH